MYRELSRKNVGGATFWGLEGDKQYVVGTWRNREKATREGDNWEGWMGNFLGGELSRRAEDGTTWEGTERELPGKVKGELPFEGWGSNGTWHGRRGIYPGAPQRKLPKSGRRGSYLGRM
jgi:hypothetical protein